MSRPVLILRDQVTNPAKANGIVAVSGDMGCLNDGSWLTGRSKCCLDHQGVVSSKADCDTRLILFSLFATLPGDVDRNDGKICIDLGEVRMFWFSCPGSS